MDTWSSSTSSDSQYSAAYLEQERHRFTEQRRRVYVFIGSIGLLVLLYNVVYIILDPSFDPSFRTLYVGNDLFFMAFTAGLLYLSHTRRVSLDILERALFFFASFESLVFNSFTPWWLQNGLQPLLMDTLVDDIWFLLFVCAFGLHVFPKHGWRWVCGLYLISCCSIGAYVAWRVAGGENVPTALLIVQMYAMGGTVVGFLYVLTRYRDQVQRLGLHYEVIQQLAFTDPLTGLLNRRHMHAMM